MTQHIAAALRTILPTPLTHLSSFASLNKDYLAPTDTIHVIAKSSTNFHGIVELTFAMPTESSPSPDHITVTGTEGWLSVTETTFPSSGQDGIRVTIKSVIKTHGKPNTEIETIIDEPQNGVQVELESFFLAVEGKVDGLELGNPKGALQDVAFIQAALNSHGQLVNLEQLISQT